MPQLSVFTLSELASVWVSAAVTIIVTVTTIVTADH
jgi:hypothetical protein